MAPELLGSVRAVPQVLEDAGFDFADDTVTEVLASATAHG
jgi:NAD dependent epimerase/dehydratase family enzyme